MTAADTAALTIPTGRTFAALAGTRVESAVLTELPATLERDWRDLVADAAEPNAFAEPWFFRASLEGFRPFDGVRLLQVSRGGRLIGVMPLGLDRGYARLPVAFLQNWRHDQVFLGMIAVRRGEERAFWSAVLDHLDADRQTPNFLHLQGVIEDGPVHAGLKAAARQRGRECAVVHRVTRAFLHSDLPPIAYYERNVRKKKRKEIARLRNRLAELGEITSEVLTRADDLPGWCDTYLDLEAAGWKGRNGSALGCRPESARFFRLALEHARAAGRLQFRRLSVGGKPIAMLVNFLTAPGSFSFKTCFDEDYARFSPGVLIQLDNLDLLDRDDIAWMDSCAAEEHPMIDSLWAERRNVVRLTVRLGGARRLLPYLLVRGLERASQWHRDRAASRSAPSPAMEPHDD